MRLRPNGSIEPSGIPTAANEFKRYDDAIYRGMVIKTKFVDSDNLTKNAPNARVLYDVVVFGGFASGQILTDCRLAQDLGGNDNYHETVLTPSSKNLRTDAMVDHDGDVVFVQFIQGDGGFPVIVGLDVGYNTANKIGATKEDGIRDLRQFNGVKTEITKTGETIVSRQGGTVVDGKFKGEEGLPQHKVELKDLELVTETFRSGLKIIKDGVKDKVTMEAGFIDLGKAISDLSVLFSELANAYNGHTHTMASHTHPNNGPASPAANLPPAPLPANVASQTVKLQK